jgi:hypothetical protein
MSLYSRDQENAITPAIATILIVLMTVVLAAGVAAVTLGMVEKQPEYVVGLTAKAAPAGKDVTVTLYGSRNIPELVKAEVIDAGSSSGNYVEVWNGSAGTAPVGVPLVAEGVARPAMDRTEYATKLWVKGTFMDGTEQVLLMQAMTFRNVSGGENGATPDPKDIDDYISNDGLIVTNENGQQVTVSIPTKNNPGYSITVIWENNNNEILSHECDGNTYTTTKFSIPGNENKLKITIIVKNSAGEEVTKATYKIQKDENSKLTIAKENNS